jgi:Peptidase family M48
MKRILLFVLTNLAVMVVLGVVASLLGVNRFLTANGLNLSSLLGFSLIMGFGGAIISLLMSKPMAKWSTGAQVINQPQSADEQWIVDTVRRLSEKAGIAMPEVAIYEGEPNAFATGAFRDSALVAVSTGLLQGMTREEVEAVLGHEIAHVANGDMVTLTLIQGVLNTFVVFLSRVIGYAVDTALRRNDEENTGPGMGYYITGAGYSAGVCGQHDRGLVQPPARIPCRSRCSATAGHAATHDPCTLTPGTDAGRHPAQQCGGHGHHRRPGQAVCQPSPAGGAHCSAAGGAGVNWGGL